MENQKILALIENKQAVLNIFYLVDDLSDRHLLMHLLLLKISKTLNDLILKNSSLLRE
jgi:hypothetical protein